MNKVTITLSTGLGDPRAIIKLTNGLPFTTDGRSEAPRREFLTEDELDRMIYQAAGVKLRMKAARLARAKKSP